MEYRGRLRNITVAVPVMAIASLQRNSDPSKAADAIGTITKAVVDSVTRTKPNVPLESNEEDTASMLSFDSDGPAADTDTNLGVYGPRELAPFRGAYMFVNGLTGKIKTYEVVERATVLQFKKAIQRSDGPPSKHQRLVFGGRQLEDNRTLNSVRAKY